MKNKNAVHSLVVPLGIIICAPLGASFCAPFCAADDCPDPMEFPCSMAPSPDGAGEDSYLCECGPGEWIPREHKPILIPADPNSEQGSEKIGESEWSWTKARESEPGFTLSCLDLNGRSHWMSAGAMAMGGSSTYTVRCSQIWRGSRPACPRWLSIQAFGGAVLKIGVACSATYGCSASATAGVSGSCSSLGDASAHISNLSVSASAQYHSAQSSVSVDGNIGPFIPWADDGIEGGISADTSWLIQGTGAATGLATVSVTPDRCYCAFTNRSVTYQASGVAAASVAASADDDGSSASHASASVFLGVG